MLLVSFVADENYRLISQGGLLLKMPHGLLKMPHGVETPLVSRVVFADQRGAVGYP